MGASTAVRKWVSHTWYERRADDAPGHGHAPHWKKIKRLNIAQDYILRHRDRFVSRQPNGGSGETESTEWSPTDGDEDGQVYWLDVFPDNELFEWLPLPVYVLWWLSFSVVMVTVMFIATFQWKRWFKMGPTTEWWMRIAPHLVLLLFSLTASGTFENLWFWSSLVVVLGAEVIAHLTGWWIQRSNRSDVEVARRYIESASETR